MRVPAEARPPSADRILFASRAGFMEIGLEVSKTLEISHQAFEGRNSLVNA